jgi:H+/gluconate symporter-like permease
LKTPQSTQPGTVRILLAVIAFLIGIIAALVAGILQQMNHSTIPQAIEYGFGAFAATVMLVFAVISFIAPRRSGRD